MRLLLLTALFVWLVSVPVYADQLPVHTVREGETLSSIAQVYFGDPSKERVLQQENGLDDAQADELRPGMRLVVPVVSFHRVAEGDTWASLAKRYYDDTRRAFALAEANDGDLRKQPQEGAELLVPYPLRHVATSSISVKELAKRYLNDSAADVRRIRRFNRLRSGRVARGKTVMIPISDLKLVEEARGDIRPLEDSGGKVKSLQEEANRRLPELAAQLAEGEYAETVALGNQLLGQKALTAAQLVVVQRDLATAYVALDRQDLAVQAFMSALEKQPTLELDTVRTSPLVLDALKQARERSGAKK